MFWRRGCGAAVILSAAMAVAIPAGASAQTKLGPCTVGNPSSCTFHPRPNITVFCGREYAKNPYGYDHDFRGCRVRVGGAEVKCGTQSDHPLGYGAPWYELMGCVAIVGANRVMAGCESSGAFGSLWAFSDETCGVSPVVTCATEHDYGYGYDETTTTCGREPVVLRCFDASYPFSPPPQTVSFCELVVGPSASPIFSCRLDKADTDAALADVTSCLTGLTARRRSG